MISSHTWHLLHAQNYTAQIGQIRAVNRVHKEASVLFLLGRRGNHQFLFQGPSNRSHISKSMFYQGFMAPPSGLKLSTTKS